ncbi:MAG: zinc ABC transporter substrate-binding protein [Parachlamydiaceae bacterium]|nr:zinc ABC transporter substrate-binding protein [Parachlamydiaceae bacterium]
MKQFLQLIVVGMLLSLVGCSCDERTYRVQALQQWMMPNGKLKALSTTAMINDLVQEVGGENVDALTLIIGELDPHSYQLVKGDDEKLVFGDLIFYNGLGLEHGPSLQGFLLNQSKAIALGDKIQNADPALIISYKGQVDPHIWMDVSLWAKTVHYIVEALSKKDPVHAEAYRLNGEKLVQNMMLEHANIRDELQAIPSVKRYLVTSHDAFNYFTRAYLAETEESVPAWQERFAAPEGLAPDSQLSAKDIQEIINHLKKYNIRVIFPESNISRDSIRKIVQAAKEKGLDVKIATIPLFADAMGKKGSDGDTYLKMIKHNAKIIASYLEHNGNG